MAEDAKSGATDKPNQMSESFTLKPLWLNQTRDFDHSVQAIHYSTNQFKTAIHYRMSTSLVMILKEHVMSNGAFRNHYGAKWFTNLKWFRSLQSDRVSQIIWFRLELRSGFANHLLQIGTSEWVRESFDSDWNFGAGSQIICFRSGLQSGFANHLIQIGTSEWVQNHLIQIGTSEGSRIICFRWTSERFANHLIQIGTSERVRESFDSDWNFGVGSRIIWFRLELRSGFANHLIQIGTSEWVRESFDSDWNFGVGSRIICFRSGLQSGFANHFDNWMISYQCSEVLN